MDTPLRLLRLLTMFTVRPAWSADELADRLDVTTRTLRRDVVRLRELGYPISSTTGRYGGYELGAGGRLPPLLLDDDEAIAVAVALRELSGGADPTLGEAALAASAKLRQILPEPLRLRVDALGDVTVGVDRFRAAAPDGPRIELATLTLLAMACRRTERVTFGYVDGSDRITERRVEPHRLVTASRRWYLLGFDLDRDDWRTFRVDRIDAVAATGHRNATRPTPDAAAHVAEGVALHVYQTIAHVRVGVPLAEGQRLISPTVGIFDEPDSDIDSATNGPAASCTLRIGGDPEWIARYLASLAVPVEVLDPPEVRAELRRLGRALARQHAEPH